MDAGVRCLGREGIWCMDGKCMGQGDVRHGERQGQRGGRTKIKTTETAVATVNILNVLVSPS